MWGVATARGEREEKCFLRLKEAAAAGEEEDEVARSNRWRSEDFLAAGLGIIRWRFGAREEEKRESLREERKSNLLEERERTSRTVLSILDNRTE